MSSKIIEAIKDIDLKDLLIRASWTFVQAFLAVILITSEQLVNAIFAGDWAGLKVAALASVLGGIAAGLSALKTLVISVISKIKAKSAIL